MADYRILIQVDPYTRVFHYLTQNIDASTAVLANGDRLVWVLDPLISERTFQIDFHAVNPFQPGSKVSLRGNVFVVWPAVLVPVTAFNRTFNYSVSLGNGWHDDPCLVVPEPPDLKHA